MAFTEGFVSLSSDGLVATKNELGLFVSSTASDYSCKHLLHLDRGHFTYLDRDGLLIKVPLWGFELVHVNFSLILDFIFDFVYTIYTPNLNTNIK